MSEIVTALASAAGAAGADDERIAAAVNKALAGRLPKVLEEALAPHLTSFREQLATPKAEPQGGKGKGDAGDEVARRLQELEGSLKTEREGRATERQQALEEKAFGALQTELAGKVRPDAVGTVAKLLFHAERAVKVGKDGKVTFHFDGEEHTLAEGVAKYVKSSAADLFRPAPGYTATKPGQRPPARAGSDGKPPAGETPRAKGARLLQKLADRAGRPIF